MNQKLIDAFCWTELLGETFGAEERYQALVDWSLKARVCNPNAFDAVTQWMLDDAAWGTDLLEENRQTLMDGVIGRFRRQTAALRACLAALEQSGLVNPAVFPALDRFVGELDGHPREESLRTPVAQMFADFSAMRDPAFRAQIAGGITGPTGTDTVPLYGYVNFLKDCDAAVQWALFMPQVVNAQQRGFTVESFTYRRLPGMRFVGREETQKMDMAARRAVFEMLDTMREYDTEVAGDIFLVHHYGAGVDVDPGHGFWGRFLKPDAPVPEGFVGFDFLARRSGGEGLPYIAQFACAVFAGSKEAMHETAGFDSSAMYDVTRNIMLAQGVCIPYPDKYWVAEVFLDGYQKHSSAYLFSAEL